MIALYITIAIICVGIFLFVKEYFSIDTTSILIMALFIVTGVLSPEEGFSGFNHPATLTLGCMFVVSASVFKSGMIDGLSQKIVRLARIHYIIALIIFCITSACLSAFINDAAVVALLIPMALSVCHQADISPSKLLIPISFAALFGGTCTLIGTSTNILVSSYAEKSGLTGFGMFEFSKAALCLLIIGLLYLFLVAPFLLPNRKSTTPNNSIQKAEEYIAELVILSKNKDVGKPIAKSSILRDLNVQIIFLKRGTAVFENPSTEIILQEHDILKIAADPITLQAIQKNTSIAFKGETQRTETEQQGYKIYEVMIPYGSNLANFSLNHLNFMDRYHATVIAIRHRNETILHNITDVILKEGDMLLLYTDDEAMQQLIQAGQVISLSTYSHKQTNYKKGIPALLIAIGVVAAAATGLTSILISAMIGCVILVTTSVIKPKEAYDAIEWKVIFMMAGVLSMGKALEKTGGAGLISEHLVDLLGSLDPRWILGIIYLIAVLSTNILSSKATAALLSPIVISIAQSLQVSEKPFLIAVMFACSLTFMSPVSYPTNTMVYSPGNYQFKDYLRVGTPLNILIWIAACFVIPYFFPFK